MDSTIKMYCIFSRESLAKMQGNRGKACAQAGHAYLHAWWAAEKLRLSYVAEDNEKEYSRLFETMGKYKNGDDARKICLVVDTDADLRRLVADYQGFTGTTLVEDCGYTVVDPGTITCAGIGPLRDSEKGDDLRELELYITG